MKFKQKIEKKNKAMSNVNKVKRSKLDNKEESNNNNDDISTKPSIDNNDNLSYNYNSNNIEIIEMDFEIFDPKENDKYQLKRIFDLFYHNIDHLKLDLFEICNYLSLQIECGGILKGDKDSAPLGILSIINLNNNIIKNIHNFINLKVLKSLMIVYY